MANTNEQLVNYRILPQSCESDCLAPNPHNITFPITALHVLPPSIHHTLICLSLSHFVNSLPVSTGKRLAAGNWDKIFQHRGAALRELTTSISKTKTRCSDTTITSVMMFLAAEVSFAHLPNLVWTSVGLTNDGIGTIAFSVRLADSRSRTNTTIRNARWYDVSISDQRVSTPNRCNFYIVSPLPEPCSS